MTFQQLIKEKNIKIGDKVVINYLGDCVVGIAESEPALVQNINLFGWDGQYDVKVLVRGEDGKPYYKPLTQVNRI